MWFLSGAHGIATDEVADNVPGKSLIVQISVIAIADGISALMALVGVVGWRLGRKPARGRPASRLTDEHFKKEDDRHG